MRSAALSMPVMVSVIGMLSMAVHWESGSAAGVPLIVSVAVIVVVVVVVVPSAVVRLSVVEAVAVVALMRCAKLRILRMTTVCSSVIRLARVS